MKYQLALIAVFIATSAQCSSVAAQTGPETPQIPVSARSGGISLQQRTGGQKLAGTSITRKVTRKKELQPTAAGENCGTGGRTKGHHSTGWFRTGRPLMRQMR